MFSFVLKMLSVDLKMFSDVRPLTLFTCLPYVRWFYDDFQKLHWFAMILPPDREKKITNLTSRGLKIVATINFVRLGKTI